MHMYICMYICVRISDNLRRVWIQARATKGYMYAIGDLIVLLLAWDVFLDFPGFRRVKLQVELWSIVNMHI